VTVAPATEPTPAARRRGLGPSTSLLHFVLRRLGAFVLLMLGINLVGFVLTELVPSNAAATNLGEQAAADPAAVKAFEEHSGLDKPLPPQ
jgi:peptide/nickel transport system permease protein